MGRYACEVHLNATAPDIYRAITTPVGLRSWWTATCDVSETEGSDSTFRFGPISIVMRVEELVPHELVRWRCLEHLKPTADSREDAVDWAGSSIVFRLEPCAGERTVLRFEHYGPTSASDFGPDLERSWQHFLTRSLKAYIETSVGEPHGSRRALLELIA